MKDLLDQFRQQRFNLYYGLFEAMIERIRLLGFNPVADDETVTLNPMAERDVEHFWPRWISTYNLHINYKEVPITLTFDEDVFLVVATMKLWERVPARYFTYYMKNYAKDMEAGVYSQFREHNRSHKSNSLKDLLDKVKSTIDKSMKIKELREAELTAGKGLKYVYC